MAAQGLTLKAWLERLASEESTNPSPLIAGQAAEHILELQRWVKPDPEGWTVKDYIGHGRPEPVQFR